MGETEIIALNKAQSSFLGILNRAGKLSVGTDIIKKRRKIALLLLASDASDNTKSEMTALARSVSKKLALVESKTMLGQPIGYESIAAIGILDQKCASAFLEKGRQE